MTVDCPVPYYPNPSITVGWELLDTGTAVVRQISVRKFGEVEEERVLVRDEQGDTAERTRLYTVSGLEAGAGYTVCFATIYGEEGGQEGAREGAKCREVNTLQPDFPVPEVTPALAPPLEGTARYAGFLLAPAEGFGLRP